MPLDQATADFLGKMGEAGFKPFHQCTPEEVRAGLGSLRDMYGAGPEMASVQEHVADTADGCFGIRVLVPNARPRAVIVYYHGGGWVFGTPDDFDTLGRRLAECTGCAVALVDYRLSPEHHYPAAVDDAYAALGWVSAHVKDTAGADVPLIVAGDSAGGTLAAVTALRARDQHGPVIAMQILIYPVTDASANSASYAAPENQLLLSREDMAWFWDQYLPDTARRTEPDASPLRANSLAGLPPTLMITAEYDVTRDDSEAYATRLEQAGVPVEKIRYAGETHGFFTLLVLPGGAKAMERIAAAVARRLDA